MPPKATLEQAFGFSLFMAKAVMGWPLPAS